MIDFIEQIRISIMQFSAKDVVDILIVAFVMYILIKMLAKTRAVRALIGLGVVLVLARVFQLLNLQTVTWLLSLILNAGAILIVVLFQPEIRRALERIGRGNLFLNSHSRAANADDVISEFSQAILSMAKHTVGAIIVFERKAGLSDVLDSGIMINAIASQELIENIFYPNTPLHDGAMIVRDGKITAAGCFLPLSDNRHINSELGTRHRAALGVSEISDAYVFVVSEERGTISFAYDGNLEQNLTPVQLKNHLSSLFIAVDEEEKKKKKGAKEGGAK